MLRFALPQRETDALRAVAQKLRRVGSADGEAGNYAFLAEAGAQVARVHAGRFRCVVILAGEGNERRRMALDELLVGVEREHVEENGRVREIVAAEIVLRRAASGVVQIELGVVQLAGKAVGEGENAALKRRADGEFTRLRDGRVDFEFHQIAVAAGGGELVEEDLRGARFFEGAAVADETEFFDEGKRIVGHTGKPPYF